MDGEDFLGEIAHHNLVSFLDLFFFLSSGYVCVCVCACVEGGEGILFCIY